MFMLACIGRRQGERAPADPQLQERVLGQLRRVLDLLVGNVKAKAGALQQQGRAVRVPMTSASFYVYVRVVEAPHSYAHRRWRACL